jgi:predicted ester cyclase
VLENKIYREWLVTDTMALVTQLGLDPHALAEGLARDLVAKGQTTFDIGENRRILGQYPPEAKADLSLAHTEREAWCLAWLHEVYNRRMLGHLKDVYAPTVQYHGTNMRELYGQAAVLQQTLRLIGTLPDCAYLPLHICSQPCDEGGEKIAVRWILEGHHLGHALLGAPTGHRVFVQGMTHFHVVDGRVVEEWAVYDELAMLAQVKLGAMTA